MGNTPTQQPHDGDPTTAGEPTSGASLRERVTGVIGGAVGAIRSRLSVFPDLDLDAAFVVSDEELGLPPGDVRARNSSEPAEPSRSLRETAVTFPARDEPLTRPARDDSAENSPDLEATEEDGRLAIYYPDRTGARITSDTWRDLER